MIQSAVVTAAAAGLVGTAIASVSPFTETFDTAANWAGSDFQPLTEVATGGLDGSSYVSTTGNFQNVDPTTDEGSFQVLFRGEPSFLPGIVPDASDGAFIGDYIDAGIETISLDVRHDGVAPVNFFVRIANVNRFPGAVAVFFVPVFAGSWATIEIDISADSPNFVSFEGQDYDAVFSNAGVVQVGIDARPLAGIPSDFTFDVDNVSINVPTPGAFAAVALGGFAAARRRR
ncbi:MAG: hypothetical protein AAF297_00180 [Planctomycetota bacterium]